MSRISTIDKLQTKIEKDIAWRKKECADIFAINALQTEYSQKVSIKASIVILYSHWEGFVKKASALYLDFLSSQRLTYQNLNEKFIVHYISQTYCDINTKFTKALIYDIHFQDKVNHAEEVFRVDGFTELSKFSNINSEQFFGILRILCIDMSSPIIEYFDLKGNFLDETIVGKRNSIAHGNYTEIDFEMYRSIHEVILTMLDKYATLLLDAAENEDYLKEEEEA
ncbi:MAE_28990/MAE_18760 family HEPN-like nuclease [Psychrobacter sp. Pi2-52]|uniref:MAE_28990/MAE_18760 family HEPN-like nuclease n=1 Tax=Psychrobacter sp. Pi2-52 TaxID=2774133 RepID=UPI0019181C24|nr:MAE_28990/MAE_18760 family HEPN-like nuclease [Psychrobacter sp. Pi2-52]